jgi:hypothetical protein
MREILQHHAECRFFASSCGSETGVTLCNEAGFLSGTPVAEGADPFRALQPGAKTTKT